VDNKKENKRKLHVNKHFDILQERRLKQKEKCFKDEMKVRAQVEGTIAELVRKHGLKKAKYKGKDGRQLQFYLTGTALNIKRIIRLIENERKCA